MNSAWAIWRLVLARGGHARHAQLARRQGVAAPERIAARPAAGDDELLARTLREAERTVAVREVEAAPELLAGRAALAAAPQGRAEVHERGREVERRR